MRYLFATIIFYLIPPVPSNCPFNVISPVIATPGFTFSDKAREAREATIVKESVEPSFLNAPSGAWT